MNREVQIRHRVRTQNAADGSYVYTWSTLATAFAEVQDQLPSRGERIADGVDVKRRPCRVRMYWRDDVTSAMQLRVLGRGDEDDRDLRIVSGPAELGYRDRMEFVAEELEPGGQEP